MNKLLQNYAILNLNLVPNNPIETFLPFVVYSLIEEKPDSITEQSLTDLVERRIGISILHPLMNNIIAYLYNNNKVLTFKQKGCYKIDYKKLMKLNSMNFSQSKEIERNLEKLKELYINFIKCENLSLEEFSNIFISFLNKYDNFIFVNYGNITSVQTEETIDEEKRNIQFVNFLKYLETENVDLFKLVLNICYGSLMETYILDKTGQEIKIWHGMDLYLDTPIVLRILGYSGDYYKKEYRFMLEQWKKMGATIKVFDFTYHEIIKLLQNCEKWIDSVEYDYSKASEILNYFKYNKKNKNNIIESLNSLKDDLKDYDIQILDTDSYIGDIYNNLVQEFKVAIRNKYNEANYIDSSGNNKRAIEFDARSLTVITILNHKETLLFKDLTEVFVTTNSCLVEIYEKRCGKLVSPVVKDTVLSLSSCNSIEENERYLKLKFMSFCQEIFQPSLKNKEKYIKLLEKLKLEGKITKEKYILLRNHSLVPKMIEEITKGNLHDLDEQSVLNAVDKVELEMVKNAIDDLGQKHVHEMQNLKNSTLDEKANFLKIDYNKYVNILIVLDLFLTVIIILCFVGSLFVVNDKMKLIYKILIYTSIGIVLLYNIITVISSYISTNFSKGNLVNFILNKKFNKLKKKYNIPDEYKISFLGLKKYKINK